ncbi:unnamed protein product [Adineta steineri]|uniref:Uncharacterized protein n=1 Tax=Adineta steineri TaxID=433720 RepID=A0A818RNN8_9BILA|nr:unnamed protein product [Adineta steineri]CAF3660814.1 unnamed protein product [Adineta steineri]
MVFSLNIYRHLLSFNEQFLFFQLRLIIRLLSNLKRSHLKISSNNKVCQAFVISSNQYGSFRGKQSITRSNSLISNEHFILANKQVADFSNCEIVNLTINHYSNIIENSQYQQTKTHLLEHYLTTYNPLQIDLNKTDKETITTSNIKGITYEEIPSETDTQPIDNCYPLHCTNKHRLYRTGRYVRLKEQENCSATMSITDDHLSECSTKLTSIVLPTVMITDCSDSKRLHTDIIEMNEEED